MSKFIKIILFIILALAVFFVVYIAIALNTKGASVAMVLPDMPGAEAGIRGGDLIISADNKRVKNAKEFINVTNVYSGTGMEISFYRGFNKMTVTAIPSVETKSNSGRLGIAVTDKPFGDQIITFLNSLKR